MRGTSKKYSSRVSKFKNFLKLVRPTIKILNQINPHPSPLLIKSNRLAFKSSTVVAITTTFYPTILMLFTLRIITPYELFRRAE